jgi:ketosteroid isomerase-like protein
MERHEAAATKAALIERMRAKDLAGALELIAEDAVYFWSNGTAMFGRAAIGDALQANFASIEDDTYDVDDIVWLAATNDVAACVFRFRWTGVVSGTPVSGAGRGATVLRRTDGRWVVVHENLSSGSYR